jgi:hypothetical protein
MGTDCRALTGPERYSVYSTKKLDPKVDLDHSSTLQKQHKFSFMSKNIRNIDNIAILHAKQKRQSCALVPFYRDFKN